MFELPHPQGNVKVMLLFSCISQQVKYKLLPVKTDGGFDNSNWFQRQVDDGWMTNTEDTSKTLPGFKFAADGATEDIFLTKTSSCVTLSAFEDPNLSLESRTSWLLLPCGLFNETDSSKLLRELFSLLGVTLGWPDTFGWVWSLFNVCGKASNDILWLGSWFGYPSSEHSSSLSIDDSKAAFIALYSSSIFLKLALFCCFCFWYSLSYWFIWLWGWCSSYGSWKWRHVNKIKLLHIATLDAFWSLCFDHFHEHTYRNIKIAIFSDPSIHKYVYSCARYRQRFSRFLGIHKWYIFWWLNKEWMFDMQVWSWSIAGLSSKCFLNTEKIHFSSDQKSW